VPSPTQSEWRILSTQTKGLIPDQIRFRQLRALSTFVSGTNPDGSNRSGAPTPNIFSAEDSSFEGGTVGTWLPGNLAVLANTTAVAQSGTHSLQVTSGNNGNPQPFSILYPVSPASTYLYSIWSQAATAGRSITLSLRWFNASTTVINPDSSITFSDVVGSWTQGLVTARPNPGAVSVRPIVLYNSTVLNGEVHYLDNAYLGLV